MQRNNFDWWWLNRELIKITEKGCLYFLKRVPTPKAPELQYEFTSKVGDILKRKADEEEDKCKP